MHIYIYIYIHINTYTYFQHHPHHHPFPQGGGGIPSSNIPHHPSINHPLIIHHSIIQHPPSSSSRLPTPLPTGGEGGSPPHVVPIIQHPPSSIIMIQAPNPTPFPQGEREKSPSCYPLNHDLGGGGGGGWEPGPYIHTTIQHKGSIYNTEDQSISAFVPSFHIKTIFPQTERPGHWRRDILHADPAFSRRRFSKGFKPNWLANSSKTWFQDEESIDETMVFQTERQILQEMENPTTKR